MRLNALVVVSLVGLNGALAQDSRPSADSNSVVTVTIPEVVSGLLAHRISNAWRGLVQRELPLEVALWRDVIARLEVSECNTRVRDGSQTLQVIHVTEVLSYSREMAPIAGRLNITTLGGSAKDDDVGFVIRGVAPDYYTIVRAVNDGKESSAELIVCVQGTSADERSTSVIRKRFLYDTTTGHWNGIGEGTAKGKVR